MRIKAKFFLLHLMLCMLSRTREVICHVADTRKALRLVNAVSIPCCLVHALKCCIGSIARMEVCMLHYLEEYSRGIVAKRRRGSSIFEGKSKEIKTREIEPLNSRTGAMMWRRRRVCVLKSKSRGEFEDRENQSDVAVVSVLKKCLREWWDSCKAINEQA